MYKKHKGLFYIVFFSLLILAFWFFLFRGTDNWKSKLPVMGYVQPFSFVNQYGDSLTQASTAGKVYVANYFFATCQGICPKMNHNIDDLYKVYKGNKDIMFVSHTCQPENDSVPVLKHYADSMGIQGTQWQFVTGPKLDLYRTARESYKIDDPKNNVGSVEDQFLHSQFLALVDKKGRLRGIYDGLKSREMKLIDKDIKGLLEE